MNEPTDDSQLPIGWASATIGDLIGHDGVFIDGDWVETKDQDPNGDVRLIQLADVGDGKYRNRSNRFLTSKKAVELGCTFLKPTDILIARMPDPLGRACTFPGDERRCVTVVDVCVVRVGSHGVNGKWLMNFINAIDFRAAIASLQSGSTRKRISRGNLATLSVPVPPLAEQERLVEKIDELLTKLEAGVAELRKTQAQLKLYRQSVLNAAVKGELTKVWREAHQAELEPASELLARILKERREKWEASQMAKKRAAGKTSTNDDWKMKYRQPEIPRNRELRELPRGWGWVTVEQLNPFDRPCAYGVLQPGGDFENGVLFVRVGDIGEGKIDASKLKRIDPQIARAYPRTRLLGKEVLITLVGAIGRTAVVPRSLAGANTARAVGVIPICENVSSDWAEIWFRNPEKVQEMTNLSHEVARKTLNLEDVRTALVALPSLSEQYMIVSETERLLSVADNIGRTIEQSLKQAERMRQSILKQAFEGRLVPQDQSDEPAGLLLERIKIERAKREVEKSAASKANRGPFKKKQTKRVEGAAA